MFFYRSQNHLNFYQFCYDTTETNAVLDALRRDRHHARQYWRFRAQRRSLPEYSDDSRSRSEITTTTESSTAYSTRTDTFSSEPKSLPIDLDGNEDKVCGPTKPSAQVKEHFQTLVVNLPPEKSNSRKDVSPFGFRKKSKSLELIVLPKKSPNESNKTCNGDVTKNTEKKDKLNKAKNTLRAVLAGLKNSKKFLLASSRPISSASLEPTPGTSKQSEPIPGTSKESKPVPKTNKQRQPENGTNKQSEPARATCKQTEPVPSTSRHREVYVRQSVKDRIAAQTGRVVTSSTKTKRQSRSSYNENQNSSSFSNGVYHQRSSPPSPAPADPIIKVKLQRFYLAEDGTIYEKSTINCRTDGNQTNEDSAEDDYIDAVYAEKQRRPENNTSNDSIKRNQQDQLPTVHKYIGPSRSRVINQPYKRLLPPNAERTRFQQKQQKYTGQKSQLQVTPLCKKYSYEHQATTSTNKLHLNKPGDRPANSFWRRDLSHQIELDSPPSVHKTHIIFTKGFKRNTQQKPTVEDSPSYCRTLYRRYRLPSVYIDSEETENPYTESDLYHDGNPPAREFYPRRHMGRMGSLEDHERKVIIEFCHLLEKSKQLFNGLRELPQYGHKQWHSYFGRTFDVYTKLWKFQQQHRVVLDSKYGLKRWQIGEIASKIGQLYYHFYLRTSETAYLNEAFSFYSAIRGRSYYTKACKEDKCELMVKKLRYYARFIVVCLLLKKIKLVRELIKELDRQIIEYGNTYDPDDQIEWTVVVDEVKAFIQMEPIVSVIHPDNYTVLLSHRLSPVTIPPVERSQQMILSLQEVLIIGSSSQQVKFSELTMDMFRMLQTLEREPTGEIQHMYDDSPRQRFNLTPSALNNKGYNLETQAPRSDNPHKYLLFKPLPSQILVYLASGCNDLPPNGVLLLYISADGQIVQPSKHPEDGYDIGGLITTSKHDMYRDGNKDKNSQAKNREFQCFHPGDLYPFTRRPLFIIIDSDNSVVFQNIPRHFGQPMLILMSPVEIPSGLHMAQSERKQQGNLFTLFLHSPLTALCYCCDLHSVPLILWDRAQVYLDTFLAEASQIVTRGRIDPIFLNFMGDDFLRLLILRYMFCELVLRMHRAFRTRTQRPRSAPGFPDEILEHPALVHIILDIATHLQVRPSFQEPNGNLERTSKE